MHDPVLQEILAALEMPPSGLHQWFEQIKEFCRKHGGERHYSEILSLIRQCETELHE